MSTGQRKRAPALACPVFEPPAPNVDSIEVELQRDGDLLTRARLIR
jgi:hypothetical protein